jgi:hypothetical protein
MEWAKSVHKKDWCSLKRGTQVRELAGVTRATASQAFKPTHAHESIWRKHRVSAVIQTSTQHSIDVYAYPNAKIYMGDVTLPDASEPTTVAEPEPEYLYSIAVVVGVAAKYRYEPTTVRYDGVLLAAWVAMSCTSDTVVPVYLNSSAPFALEVAW